MQARKPNWKKWSLIPDVTVWQAVALSLNIDPDKVRHSENGWMAEAHLFDESQEYRDRIEVTAANLGKNRSLPIRGITIDRPADCRTELPAFAIWAKSIEWKIPKELADLSSKAKPKGENNSIPNIRRELMTAKMGVAGADAYFAEIGRQQASDEVKRSRASNKAFAEPDCNSKENQLDVSNGRWPWGSYETKLLNKLAETAQKFWVLYDPADKTTAPTNEQVEKWLVEQGVSGKIAAAMATILRTDGLATGPRR